MRQGHKVNSISGLENKWTLSTFDVSSAFFKETHGFWLLNAALYVLREGARNWYDRFHRHAIKLGFETVPGDPVLYHYKEGETQVCIALHAITASNGNFYSKVITPLLSQFCISKVEKGTILAIAVMFVSGSSFKGEMLTMRFLS